MLSSRMVEKTRVSAEKLLTCGKQTYKLSHTKISPEWDCNSGSERSCDPYSQEEASCSEEIFSHKFQFTKGMG